MPRPAPVDPSPIRQVLLCDLYHRPPGHTSVAYSLPGHLVQLTTQGRTEHEVEGRRYVLEPGSALWYHEVERVRIRVQDQEGQEGGGWTFYTLNFIAESLQPPAFDQRVKKVTAETVQRFAALLDAWRQAEPSPVIRRLHVHAAINDLLASLLTDFGLARAQSFEMDEAARLWWQAENQVRQQLDQPLSLTILAQLTGRSPATLARACHAATGLPPMKRIKRIRMNLAQGLVHRSHLRISEIAARVGYERAHEFSRDYRRHFNHSPRQDREKNG